MRLSSVNIQSSAIEILGSEQISNVDACGSQTMVNPKKQRQPSRLKSLKSAFSCTMSSKTQMEESKVGNLPPLVKIKSMGNSDVTVTYVGDDEDNMNFLSVTQHDVKEVPFLERDAIPKQD